jgi:protein-L-isoaspartate(D-aspartate) O-methyltransferase
MSVDPRPADFDAARDRMVARDIRGRGIVDARVIEAFATVPRHRFIPEAAPRDAYGDFPVPIGHRQTVSQPYIVALMVELAAIARGDRVLEIGTGCGYQTAILAHVTPEVFTVEIIPELHDRARATLAALGCTTVRARRGDGNEGWAEHAPYDAIIVSAAPVAVPPALEDQLREGGRLVIPIGLEGEAQQLMRFVKRQGRLVGERITPVRFVPMV